MKTGAYLKTKDFEWALNRTWTLIKKKQKQQKVTGK